MFQVVKDKKQSSGDVKVLSVAVDTIDKDSASAIVAFDAGQSSAPLGRGPSVPLADLHAQGAW